MRVAINGTVRGVNCANIFYCQLTTSSSISQADLDAWLLLVAAAYKARFQVSIATDYSFAYAKAVLFTPGGGEIVSTATPTTWAGTGTSGSGSGALASVVSWNSGVYWRGGKPRMYLPLAQASLNAGLDTLVGSYKTALNTAGGNFRSDLNALTSGTITGTSFGFVSFRSGNAERGTPLFFAITGVTIHPRVGTQRRRLGKWQN